MRKTLFSLLLFFAAASAARAGGPVVASTAPVHASTGTAADGFVREAARRLNAPEEKISALRNRGFGKTETLTFIAVGKASKKPWDDLVKDRERGKPLRKMAEEAGLDYNKLFEESSALMEEIEKHLETIPASPSR